MNAKYITSEKTVTINGKKRRIIYVDVGNMSPKEVQKVIDHVKKYA